MKIIFATNNKGKLTEIQSLVTPEIQLLSLKDIGFEGDIPEDFETLKENAFQKAQYIFDRYQIPCFADDTGLEVEILDGAPGVYSARYAGPDCNAEDNMDLLLESLEQEVNRKAKFKTVVAFVNGTENHFFEGEVYGEILQKRQGGKGFGYDPVFAPKEYGYQQSFAELTIAQKNMISHRARAVTKFVQFLKQNET